jgi:hypothetical protein
VVTIADLDNLGELPGKLCISNRKHILLVLSDSWAWLIDLNVLSRVLLSNIDLIHQVKDVIYVFQILHFALGLDSPDLKRKQLDSDHHLLLKFLLISDFFQQVLGQILPILPGKLQHQWGRPFTVVYHF